jgi:ADP-heptose:LPS heptosyltransferase
MTGPVRPGFLTIAERGIGDALTLMPSLRALRMVRPDLHIELLTPGLFPLADNLSDVATVLDHRPLQELGDDERFEWLRQRDVAAVWNTEGAQGRWTAALRRANQLSWINAPPQQEWGHRNVLRVRHAQLRQLFPDLPPAADGRLRLTPAQEEARREFRAGFPSGSLIIGIQPGAGDPKRIWPPEKFRELALTLAARPRVTVLLFLSDAERHFLTPGYLPVRPNLQCVTIGLDAVLPRLAACDLCIGNDSGFYHLAFALGSRVVAIHRSLRGARRWAYRSPRSRAVACWMPRQLDPDWARWVSVSRVLRAARRLVPDL